MRSLHGKLSTLFLGTVMVASLTGCAVHAGYYDPYYHDYHRWNGETVYYNQWEHDTHRNHEDFKKRNDADKKAYWDWRHSHDDHH
jgi:hypothetical protein